VLVKFYNNKIVGILIGATIPVLILGAVTNFIFKKK